MKILVANLGSTSFKYKREFGLTGLWLYRPVGF